MLKLYYGGKQHDFGSYETQEKAVAAKTIVQGIMDDERSSKSSCREEVERMVELAREAAYGDVNKKDSHNLVTTRRSTRLNTSNVAEEETKITKESTSNNNISLKFSNSTKTVIQQWAGDTTDQIPDNVMHYPKIPPRNRSPQPSASTDLFGIYSHCNGRRMVSSIS